LLGAKTDIASQGEQQILLDSGSWEVPSLPVDADDVAAVRILIGREILVTSGYPSDSELLGGLHRHDEQVTGLDAAAQSPQLPRVVGNQRIRTWIGVGHEMSDLISCGVVGKVGDFRPATPRVAVLQSPRIPLPIPAGSDYPSPRHADKVRAPQQIAMQIVRERLEGRKCSQRYMTPARCRRMIPSVKVRVWRDNGSAAR
jgi:hypothetical protein